MKKFLPVLVLSLCLAGSDFASVMPAMAEDELQQDQRSEDDSFILWQNLKTADDDGSKNVQALFSQSTQSGTEQNKTGDFSAETYLQQGETLHYLDGNGQMVKNRIIEINGQPHYFNPNGDEILFNSSELEVVVEIKRVFESQGTELQNLFDWTVQRISWKDDPLDWTIQRYALQGFQTGKGNCFSYAAVFYYLARFLGYDAQFVKGSIQYSDGSRSDHGWVMIDLDGKEYICDPQATDQYASKGLYAYMADPKKPPVRYVFPDCDYPDVLPTDSFRSGVAYVTKEGIMSGYEDFYFHPEDTITRGMIATILYRLEGSPEISTNGYEDVPDWSFYKKASTWATESGVMTGNETEGQKNTFDGENPITRQDLAVVFERYTRLFLNRSTDLSKQVSGLDCDSYAIQAVSWALQEELVDRTDSQFLAKEPATRAVTAVLLERLLS